MAAGSNAYITFKDQYRRGGKRLCHLIVNYGQTMVLILVYYVFSIGLTFYQKNLFKELPFPLTVVLVHLFMKFLLAGVWRAVSRRSTPVADVAIPWQVYLTRVFPAGASAGLDIGMSQWSLEFITVTLYTMSKSTALLFILIFAIIFKLEEFRWSVVALVCLIAGGLLMFTYKYTQFDSIGFGLVMTASVLSGLRWTLSQLLMQQTELGLNNPVDLVYHIQPWMSSALLPLAIAIEGSALLSSPVALAYTDGAVAGRLWGRVVLGALIAFCMELSEYHVVRRTSSLTFSISGVAKEVATLSLAIHFYQEQLSAINKAGLAVCVCGIVLHVYTKTRTSRARTPSGDGDVAMVARCDDDQPLLGDEERGSDV